jgi:hypothetical protein
MGKKSGSGSGMNNPDHIGLKYLNSLIPGSGMEKIRIRDLKKVESGIGKNIPDPQH